MAKLPITEKMSSQELDMPGMQLTIEQLYAAIRQSLDQGNPAQASNLISIGLTQQPDNPILQHLETLSRSASLEQQLGQLAASVRRILSMSVMSSAHLGRAEIRDIIGRIDDPKRLEGYGWKCYSQNDEDGIIHEIFARLDIGPDTGIFVEFGVERGIECNTHLLLTQGFHGVWLEGAPRHAEDIRKVFSREIGSGALCLKETFITAENINSLLSETVAGRHVALLSIDIDGNDYWIWNAISVISPFVVVVEYNGKFPPPLRLVQRYRPDHTWDKTDAFGCSLSALEELGRSKGYRLVGCNITGINAFFVREDIVHDRFPIEQSVKSLYHSPRYHLTHDAFCSVGHASSHGDFICPAATLADHAGKR